MAGPDLLLATYATVGVADLLRFQRLQDNGDRAAGRRCWVSPLSGQFHQPYRAQRLRELKWQRLHISLSTGLRRTISTAARGGNRGGEQAEHIPAPFLAEMRSRVVAMAPP